MLHKITWSKVSLLTQFLNQQPLVAVLLSLSVLIGGLEFLPQTRRYPALFTQKVHAQAPSPSSNGSWGPAFPTQALMVHATLLPTGKVLYWNTNYSGDAPGMAQAYFWDPANPYTSQGPINPPGRNPNQNNLFCTGHILTPGGRLLAVGGHMNWWDPNGYWGSFKGLPYANIFDPSANAGNGAWSSAGLPNMAYSRWYPTATPLASGGILVQSGTDQNGAYVNVPELWQPDGFGSGTWTALTGVQSQAYALSYYPWTYVDPRLGHEGWVFVAGPGTWTDSLDTNGTGQWMFVGPGRDNGRSDANPYNQVREYGSSVLYDRGKILIAGGESMGTVPTNSSEVVDLFANPPLWRQTYGAMATGRKYLTLTMLPDGRVLATGGTNGDCGNETDESNHAVLQAEVWNPNNEQWTPAGQMAEARLYHSIALLLPDATVLVAGGGEGGSCNGTGFAQHQTAQIYSPSYLFQGGQRPAIYWVQNQIGYNQTIQFWVSGDSSQISQVNLVRLPSVTHSFNENQFFYKMPIVWREGNGNGGIQVTTPGRWEELPPGHYMMFVVNQQDVPSTAAIVHIGDPNSSWHQQ